MKISIVVPIYRVEEYLKQCIESVLVSQGYNDYELILVDDGSPDQSGMICDEYNNDPHVVIVHKINGGLSDARNTGVCIATGDYIIFLDSDDYWNDSRFLEDIQQKIENEPADVILFGVTDHYMSTGKENISVQYDPKWFSGKKADALQILKDRNIFPGAAWHVAVSRKLIVDNEIEFPIGMLSEDIDWLLNVFYYAESISAVENIPYVYRKNRSGSITSKNDEKHVSDIITIVQKWNNEIEKIQDDTTVELLKDRLSYYYFTAMIISGGLNNIDFKAVEHKLLQNQKMLSYSNDSKIRTVGLITKFAGMRNMAIILNRMYAIRRNRK